MKKLILFLILILLPLVAWGQGAYYVPDIASGTNDGNFKNITANATYGSELITWTDAGWNEDGITWTFADGVLTHITGNTTAVTGTVTGALTVGRTARVMITGTGGGATATYTLGGNTGTTIAASGDIAIVDFLTTVANSELVITPANTCTVAITNISVMELVDKTGDGTFQGDLFVGSKIKSIGGANGITILPNGYVGINNTAPTVPLDIVGGGKTSTSLSANNGNIQFGIFNSYNGLYSVTNDMGFTQWTGSTYQTPLIIRKSDAKILLSMENITAGSGTGLTVNDPGSLNHAKYKVTCTYAAFTDTDTTKGIVIATLPAKTKIVGFYADITTAFKGGAVTAATLEVGITAEGAAEILAPLDIWTATATYGLADSDMGGSMTRAAQIQGGYLPSWSETTDIYATIDTTSGNLNALTQGDITFYIETERF